MAVRVRVAGLAAKVLDGLRLDQGDVITAQLGPPVLRARLHPIDWLDKFAGTIACRLLLSDDATRTANAGRHLIPTTVRSARFTIPQSEPGSYDIVLKVHGTHDGTAIDRTLVMLENQSIDATTGSLVLGIATQLEAVRSLASSPAPRFESR